MTARELDFSRLNFRSPETPDRKWLEWFREEFSRRVFQADVETNADAPFWLDASIRLLPDLAVYVGGTSPMHWEGDGVEESFGLAISLGGQLLYKSGGTDILVEPGAAIVGRLPDMLDTQADTRLLSLRLSPRLLTPLVPNLADLSLVSLPAHAQPTRLLINYLKMLDAEEAIESPEARHLVAQHVHDLAALAIGTSRDGAELATARGLAAARLAAVKDYIQGNLASPSLSAAIVAVEQGVTPRYIHMLFEAEGVTFSQYVLDQRLTRAHRMLSDPRYAAQSISAVALAMGFGDLSYFNRTFRRRFGMTPSDVRARRPSPQ
ncbi:AraC family transcriptional regulator, positive regulator of tynA and feaB [Hyphomicrobium sp. 1Nfss2.1]|uniref:helix-turn-helix transcriptional regulator n=1 Tax=Hyphomicrobium sp. 1Nfss2.1 TaxID=3413936 RepID=UPI003C7C9722